MTPAGNVDAPGSRATIGAPPPQGARASAPWRIPERLSVRARALARAAVRAPLLAKLIVVDVIVTATLLSATAASLLDPFTLIALAVTLAFNLVLVYAALLPLRTLQAAAARVAAGDISARVRLTPFTDRDIVRIADTLNQLLDGVTADRERMRALASEVISAGDAERAHIARELHDSTAQSLSALDLLLTAITRDGAERAEPALAQRLRVMHQIVCEALSEVRALSHNVHPRVLDDLGLVAALEYLARRTRETTDVEVRVTSDVRATLAPPVSSTLYRVAQEAVRNAVRHAAPRSVRITVAADAHAASLTVADDGHGFDVVATEARRAGLGLFTMRERVALVSGHLHITSAPPSGGTRLHAVVPLGEAAPPPPRLGAPGR